VASFGNFKLRAPVPYGLRIMPPSARMTSRRTTCLLRCKCARRLFRKCATVRNNASRLKQCAEVERRAECASHLWAGETTVVSSGAPMAGAITAIRLLEATDCAERLALILCVCCT